MTPLNALLIGLGGLALGVVLGELWAIVQRRYCEVCWGQGVVTAYQGGMMTQQPCPECSRP
jgi:hypothetical protein